MEYNFITNPTHSNSPYNTGIPDNCEQCEKCDAIVFLGSIEEYGSEGFLCDDCVICDNCGRNADDLKKMGDFHLMQRVDDLWHCGCPLEEPELCECKGNGCVDCVSEMSDPNDLQDKGAYCG